MSKLKLYSNKAWLVPDKNPILPLALFWSYQELPAHDPDYGRYNLFLQNGKQFFELSASPDDCDVWVFPTEYSSSVQKEISEIENQARTFGKKLLLYYNSDDDGKLNLNNSILFRTSFYKSSAAPYEYAIPGWSVDFLKYSPGKKIIPIPYDLKPSVSYCGYVDYTGSSFLHYVNNKIKPLKPTWENKAKFLRGELCRVLKRNKNINTSFIYRNGFWGGSETDKNKIRNEYAQNMFSSLYSISTRGGGNFSYRLYEILSCGRIPVFLNTDCVLPWDTIVDWKQHVVWIEEKDISDADKIIVDFHASKNDDEIKEIQIKNRKLYEEYISPLGFHKQMVNFLKEKLLQYS